MLPGPLGDLLPPRLHIGMYNRMCFWEIVKKIADHKAKRTPAAQS